MFNIKSPRRALLLTLAVVILTSLSATQSKAQTVWVVCTWDTSSVYNQKDGKEKFERRFYVTEMIQTTTKVYVQLTKGVPGLESACGAYLEKTVLKAAQERGEGLESGTPKVLKNIEDSGKPVGSRKRWTYTPKAKIEQKRAEMIKEAKDAGRIIMTFNWDLSGRNEAADLAKERRRGPAKLEDPPVTQKSRRKLPTRQQRRASCSATNSGSSYDAFGAL